MDSTHESSIDFSFKARYYTLGQLTSHTRKIWIVLHGYGQLAKYFIRKFQVLDNGEHFVIAPEGLSRFYQKGFDGRVGATWMTRENRLMDIENYLNYLNAIHEQLVPSAFDPKNVVVLGFSQGAATASRWAMQEATNFNTLVLWSGIFPPDLDPDIARKKISEIELINVYGEEDPFLNSAKVEEMRSITKALQAKPRYIKFAGGHDIDQATLEELMRSY